MKKILSILGAISLVGASTTTNLVACNNKYKIHEYTKEQLAKLKEKNQINTNKQEIKDNLEWIAPQEKPFNNIDNKWYFVVWRCEKTDDWRIIKFKQSDLQNKVLDNYNQYQLKIHQGDSGLIIYENKFPYRAWGWHLDTSERYFKFVYRWNDDTNIPNLVIYKKTGEIKIKEE